ncbi:GIY-YIG nuclease family protein [Dysgonomonas termitidis]|uniref:GIY-YIG nuclease family protein n=1 Tax=Dysgonomonas termitidis TaxID=1516126 RepID=A0ABV9L1L3_9BACT
MFKLTGTHNYFVYIVTNRNRSVLYIGVTNDLKRRLYEHKFDSMNEKSHFTGKYNIFYLIYWEKFEYIEHAIDRETEIKGWVRKQKDKLISEFNPEWNFLNEEI